MHIRRRAQSDTTICRDARYERDVSVCVYLMMRVEACRKHVDVTRC